MTTDQRYTSYGGVRAPPVTTTARIERLKQETARESDLVLFATMYDIGGSLERDNFKSFNNQLK